LHPPHGFFTAPSRRGPTLALEAVAHLERLMDLVALAVLGALTGLVLAWLRLAERA
jgi:hypothetical protein